MFRVRNWTGEEINSGTRRNNDNDTRLHIEMLSVGFTLEIRVFKAEGSDGTRGTKWRKKTGA